MIPKYGETVPPFHRGTNGIHDASKLRQHPVAHELDDAAIVLGDLGLDQPFAVDPECVEGARFILTHESAIADHVSSQNCGEFTAGVLDHG